VALSPGALERAKELAGPHAIIDSVRPLLGGSHARTYLVQTTNPTYSVVVREFPIGDEAGSDEAYVLRALDGLDGLAPRLLGSDLDGSWSDHPTILISRLSGCAEITPSIPTEWAAQLGWALARIHATRPQRLSALRPVFDRAGGSLVALTGPAAPFVAPRWQDIVEEPKVLTHYDYWSGNVLWEAGTLSGVRRLVRWVIRPRRLRPRVVPP
jgi:Ser/Thr protein kinase RdoA (MazF antagonist)